MKLLASQEMDQSQSREGAERYLRQIDEELKRFRELKLSDPREFRQMFADILTIEGKVRSKLSQIQFDLFCSVLSCFGLFLSNLIAISISS